jgi:hypothetical protein
MRTYAAKLETVIDDATVHIQEDGAVRMFVSPEGAKVIFEGPDVDPNTLQSVCTYVLGTKTPGTIDVEALGNAPNPRVAINEWYFSQPWEEWRQDHALRPGEDRSVPVTFTCGSREALIEETELMLLALHQDIAGPIDVVRYFGSIGDPPTVMGRSNDTNSLVRHLGHLIRRNNDFWAETRTLPAGQFLASKLKISLPEIPVRAPDRESASESRRQRARAFLERLLAQARIVADPTIFATSYVEYTITDKLI